MPICSVRRPAARPMRIPMSTWRLIWPRGASLDIIELCQLQALISDAAGIDADVTLRHKLKELQGDFNRDAVQIF